MAEGVGFEPTEHFTAHTISSRAHSTGLCHPSVRFDNIMILEPSVTRARFEETLSFEGLGLGVERFCMN